MASGQLHAPSTLLTRVQYEICATDGGITEIGQFVRRFNDNANEESM
jgi:hypothetical protein